MIESSILYILSFIIWAIWPNSSLLDISIIDDYHKKDILKVFLEFGIINESQSIGDTYLLEDPKVEITSFLALSSSAIEKIKHQQAINLEKRLNSIPSKKYKTQKKKRKRQKVKKKKEKWNMTIPVES